MEANKEYRLVVRGRGWYCNLPNRTEVKACETG
jgi:hypothetical protein